MNKCLLATFLFLSCPIFLINADASVRTVALTGKQAPGASSGTNFSQFFAGSSSLNSAGEVALFARVSGGGVSASNDLGIWTESGTLQLAAREGSQAPLMPTGVNIRQLSDVSRFNALGQVAFQAELTTGSGGVTSQNNRAIFLDESGSVELIARSGALAPGIPNSANFESIGSPLLLNDVGDVTFSGSLQGVEIDADNSGGIWAKTNGNFRLVARRGDQASRAILGTLIGSLVSFAEYGMAMSPTGNVAFTGELRIGTGDVTDFSNNGALWAERNGTTELVARAGQQSPGAPSGVKFLHSFDWVTMNSHNQVAFSGFDSSSHSAIWSEGNGSLEMVARSGSQAPGTPPGTLFGDLSYWESRIALNDQGDVVLEAPLQFGSGGVNDTNYLGIWAGKAGDFQLIARSGSPAPETPEIFNELFFSTINNAGQVAFIASLQNDGNGIWAQDRNGNLRLIAMTGQTLEVAPGDIRTIERTSYGISRGNSAGGLSSFNDLGQLLFHATFTDGSSGMFVSDIVAVPEPHSLLLLSIVVPGTFVRRRV